MSQAAADCLPRLSLRIGPAPRPAVPMSSLRTPLWRAGGAASPPTAPLLPSLSPPRLGVAGAPSVAPPRRPLLRQSRKAG
jgi:hypothetical protein